MLSTTGRKEKLTASKGSEIEVSSDGFYHCHGHVWYRVLLQEKLPPFKRKKLSVRHLNPLLNEDYSPPVITTAFHRLLRPLPPLDLFTEVGFEEGDMIDAAHKGGWWSGWVVKVLDCGRFLVYLRVEPDVIEVERKHLRPHLVWKDEEWFRCEEKRQLTETEFSAGTSVEVRTKVEPFGNIWAPAITIKENEDGTLLVKCKSLGGGEDEWTKTSVPYSKIRPSPPPFGSRSFSLMDHVDALLESGWCPGVVSMVQCGHRYFVLLGQNKLSKDFDHSQLRPSMEWKDGTWQTQEKVSDAEESPYVEEETNSSKHVRVNLRVTRSSSATMQNNLGIAAKPAVRKKLDAVKNQKVSANDSMGEKEAHEESNNIKSVNKRKRGQPPRRFISTEPKHKTGESGSQTHDPMPNPVVEKHVDVVQTPKAKESTMVLPFVKKSPFWKAFESMEIFKAVPQRPHFSPLLEREEEFREGEAIGAMVSYTGLLEKVRDIQVHDSVSVINRIKECFLELEKHGFDVTAPQLKMDQLLSIKERQTLASEELRVAEREMAEREKKRRKLEEEIVELQRRETLLKEERVREEKEIARMLSHAAVLDRKVQNVEQEFQAVVTAPWW